MIIGIILEYGTIASSAGELNFKPWVTKSTRQRFAPPSNSLGYSR